MPPVETLVALVAVVVASQIVKAATGFGPAIVIVSLGGVLLGSRDAVVLAAILGLPAGLLMLGDSVRCVPWRAWASLAAGIVVGSLAGSLMLPLVPTGRLDRGVAAVVAAIAVWFLAGRPEVRPPVSRRALGGERREGRLDADVVDAPAGAKAAPVAPALAPPPSAPLAPPPRFLVPLGVIAGTFGGLVGMNGPPLVAALGRMPKEVLRAFLVPPLLAAGVIQVVTYSATGLVGVRHVALAAAAIPALLVGQAAGDRWFARADERAFGLAVGAVLLLAAARLAL